MGNLFLVGVCIGLFRTITFELLDLGTSFTAWTIIFTKHANVIGSTSNKQNIRHSTLSFPKKIVVIHLKQAFVYLKVWVIIIHWQCHTKVKFGHGHIKVKFGQGQITKIYFLSILNLHNLCVMWLPLARRNFCSDRNLEMHVVKGR